MTQEMKIREKASIDALIAVAEIFRILRNHLLSNNYSRTIQIEKLLNFAVLIFRSANLFHVNYEYESS